MKINAKRQQQKLPVFSMYTDCVIIIIVVFVVRKTNRIRYLSVFGHSHFPQPNQSDVPMKEENEENETNK